MEARIKVHGKAGWGRQECLPNPSIYTASILALMAHNRYIHSRVRDGTACLLRPFMIGSPYDDTRIHFKMAHGETERTIRRARTLY